MPLPLPAPWLTDPAIRQNFEKLAAQFPLATELLQDGSVTTAKLADGAVTAVKASTAAPGTISPDDTAAVGTSTSLARADHRHAITAGAASTVSGTNAEGISTSFARADHNHALGTDVVGATQIAADAVGASEIAANAVGASEIGTLPAARVFHNAAQTITAATVTTLSFNSERFDTDTIHSTVTNNSRLTCKTAGIYLITASIRWSTVGDGIRVLAAFLLNGVTFIASQSWSEGASDPPDQTLSTVYSLAVNDFVEIQVFQDSGVNETIDSVGNLSPEFSMVYLSDS